MNRVHEQCPKIDSRIVLSQKLGPKLSQVHSARRAPRPAAPARPRTQRPCLRAWLAVSRACLAIQPASCPLPSHNTPLLYCDTVPNLSGPILQYSLMCCNTTPSHLASTTILLVYCKTPPIAIQTNLAIQSS